MAENDTVADNAPKTPSANVSPRAPVRRWQELADEWLQRPLGKFLDYGCGPCGLLDKLQDRCDECHGVDVDADKIADAQARFPHFCLSAIGLDGAAPYPTGCFDTVAAVEVIEHVPDERRTFIELARLLRPGGRLLITTPHRGFLTFIDPGNFKFVFPRLHRFIHLHVWRDRAYYERRFVRGEQKGLAGDITVAEGRRAWHRHYRLDEILSFCPEPLRLETFGVYFPGMRALMTFAVVLRICTGGLLRRLPWPLSALERRLSRVESHRGDQLVILFRKAG